MEGVFNLKGGDFVTAYLWSEYFEPNCFRKTVSVRNSTGGGKDVPLCEDAAGRYFVWCHEKIYLKDFLADDVRTMSARLQDAARKNDRWLVHDDEVWATFMKHDKDILIIAPMDCYDIVIPMMGFGIVSDNKKVVVCDIDESRYSKKEWSYKIGFAPHDLADKAVCASKNMYWSDFCGFLKSGRMAIVSKADFIVYLREGGKNDSETLQEFLDGLRVKETA